MASCLINKVTHIFQGTTEHIGNDVSRKFENFSPFYFSYRQTNMLFVLLTIRKPCIHNNFGKLYMHIFLIQFMHFYEFTTIQKNVRVCLYICVNVIETKWMKMVLKIIISYEC